MQNIVFLPGLNRDERSYRKLVTQSPKKYTIFFLEHSELFIGSEFRPEEKIANFLLKNHLPKAIFAGHSLGGAIVLEFASKNPGKVERLILIDSAGIPGRDNFFSVIRNFWLEHGFGLIFRNLRELAIILKNPNRQFFLAKYGHTVNLEKEVKALKVKTMILWGEKDNIIPLRKGEKLKQLIKKSKLVVFPDVGHDWILNRPELFWENI